MVKRVRGESPLGAVVRLLVSVEKDQASAERLADAFAQATLPKVMESLREARLPAPRQARLPAPQPDGHQD